MRDINQIIECFTTNDKNKVILDEKAKGYEAVMNFVYEQHQGVLPNDFIFEKICEGFEAIRDFEVKDEDDFESKMGEMTDGMNLIYTHELITHYSDFSDYADAAKVDNVPENATILDCITMGCYLHCMELLTSCWEFLQTDEVAA